MSSQCNEISELYNGIYFSWPLVLCLHTSLVHTQSSAAAAAAADDDDDDDDDNNSNDNKLKNDATNEN